ncbi:MAG: DUF3794 and LysM peptidoglycan-binding domain-containing protein [Eubacterium sp.]
MELIKSNIHMNKIIKNEAVSMHVNHEERVSEANPEINNIINHRETVTTDNVSVRNNQIVMNGTISYGILYYTNDNGMIHGIEGEIPFEETIKVPGLEEDSNVDVRLVVISSSVKLVDSRNYIYKVQMMAYITVEKMEDLEAVTAMDKENVMTRYYQIDGLSMIADKTDTFRISEQVSVSSNKPAIDRIVWKDVRIKSVNTKMMDGMIHIGGELYLFIMYVPEEEGIPHQWIETTLNFGGTIEMSEAMEGMVSYIDVDLHNVNVEPQMNQDNETRILDINALLKLNIKIYEERQMEVLEDVYSPNVNLIPVMEEKVYEKLLVKNASRTKSTVKLNIDQSKGSILQICNSGAEVKIENILVSDNGLKAIGKIRANIMYISSDDTHPVCCEWKETDFEHRIDADGITLDDKYYINWRVEQVNSNMLSTEEVEIKAVIALEAIVFKEEKRPFITQINEEPIDIEAMNAAPILKGYVVQSGDTLWKLAKENYTTIEKIMKVNDLTSQQIKKGDRLLLVKSCQ